MGTISIRKASIHIIALLSRAKMSTIKIHSNQHQLPSTEAASVAAPVMDSNILITLFAGFLYYYEDHEGDDKHKKYN